MASKTVVGSLGHHQITMTVSQSSQDTNNNRTTVSYSVVLAPYSTYRGYDWKFSNSDPFTVTYYVNGTQRTCTTRTYDGSSTVTLASGTQTVDHNTDGTKSINWSFSFTSQSGYSYLPGSGSSGTQTLTLTTIPRETTFGSSTPSSCTLKSSMTIYFDRKSTSYTHRLYYKIGSTETEITSGAITNSSKAWTPPISLASKNTTGTTISCTLIIRTYNGSTKIGSDKTKAITLNIPNDSDTKPSISIALTDTKSYSGTYGGYVQGRSGLKTTITSSGKQSATIKSYSITYRQTSSSGAVLATSTSSSYTWTPTKSGTIYISASVTDSRGFTNSTSSTATVVAYANPTITSFTANRYSDTTSTTVDATGAYARASYKVSYYPLKVSGTAKNSLNVTVYYKLHSDGESSWSTTGTGVVNSTSAEGITNAMSAAVANSYDFKIVVKDNFNTSETIYQRTAVSTATTFMHWRANGTGVAFGKMSENNNCLEVGWPYILMERNGQPTFWMHRTDDDTQAAFYLWQSDTPALQFMYKKAGDTSWTYGASIGPNAIRPRTNNGMDLGTSSYNWSNIYGTTIYENGTSLASKYAPIVSTVLNNGSLDWSNGSTVASGSWVTVGSYKFSAGRYLIMTRVEFAGNASGNRQMMWTSSDTSTSAWTQQSYSTCAGHNGWTNLQSVFYANITTSESKYLRVIQSSGSALATYVYVQIIGV